MIFKVQKAVIPADGPWLIYDRNRRFEGQVAPTKRLRELMGDELKIYVEGNVDARGLINISGIASAQNW